MAPATRPTQRGFTTIEMLVVLGILGSLTVASLSMRPAGDSTALARTADSIFAAVATARAQARRSDAVAGVTFDLARRRIALDDGETRAIPPEITITVTTSAANVTQGAVRLLFFPDGSSSGGRIKLAGRSNAVQIEVNWASGRAVRGGA